MTRKHFILIANILRAESAPLTLCKRFAAAFHYENPNFDEARFLEACGHKET